LDVRYVIIEHVISADAYIYRRGKVKVILGPAGCSFRCWSAGKNVKPADTASVHAKWDRVLVVFKGVQ